MKGAEQFFSAQFVYFHLKLLNTWNVNRKRNSISHISEAIQSKYFYRQTLSSCFLFQLSVNQVFPMQCTEKPYQADLQDPSLKLPFCSSCHLAPHPEQSFKKVNLPGWIFTHREPAYMFELALLKYIYKTGGKKIKLKYYIGLYTGYPISGQSCSRFSVCCFTEVWR